MPLFTEDLKDVLDVIDLDALNAYNAEQVEEGETPVSIWEAYQKVRDAIDDHACALCENTLEKAYENIDRFVEYNCLSYDGNDLGYVDNTLFVSAIAQKTRENIARRCLY